MDDLIGPLSEGKVLLQMAVVLSVGLVVFGAGVLELLDVSLPLAVTRWAPVVALVLGVGALFGAHVLWHYYQTKRSG